MTLKEHEAIGCIVNDYLGTLIDDANHFGSVSDRFAKVDPEWSHNMYLLNQAYEFMIGAIISHMRAYDFDLTVKADTDYE